VEKGSGTLKAVLYPWAKESAMKKKNLLCISLLLVLMIVFVACNGNPNSGGSSGGSMSTGMYGEIADYMDENPQFAGDWNKAAIAYIESRLPAEYELIMRFSENDYTAGAISSSNIVTHKYVKTAEGLWLEQTRTVNGASPVIEGGIKIRNGVGGADDILYIYNASAYTIVNAADIADAELERDTLKASLFSAMTWYGSFGSMFDAIELAMEQVSQMGYDFIALLAQQGLAFTIDRNATLSVGGTARACDMFGITIDDTVDDPSAPSPTYHVMECFVDKTNGICLKLSNIDYAQRAGDVKESETIIETTSFKTASVTPILFP